MATAKTVTLTIGERVAALRVFDAFKGGLATLRILLEDVKQLPVTEAEWTEAGLVKTPTQDGQENWKWDEKVSKEVTFQPEVVDYLRATIKAKSDNNEITLQDLPLSSLDEKLV